MDCKIYEEAIKKIRTKYTDGCLEHGGVGLQYKTKNQRVWLEQLQQEHIDAVFYIEKILQDMDA